MAGGAPISTNLNTSYDPNKSYALPMAIMTAFFFMIGFITCLNDVLIPSMKGIFNLEGYQAMFIQFCFFLAYFIVSPFAGFLINSIGYKKGLMVGLIITSMGLFGFVPAANYVSYELFLTSLFIVGSGFAVLQVAVNPYIPLLGAPETASSRLNLGGAFNSIGTFIAPIIGGYLILSNVYSGTEEEISMAKAASVKGPYIVLALMTLFLAGVLAFIKLPQITGETVEEDEPVDYKFGEEDLASSKKEINAVSKTQKLTDFIHLLFGSGAIFFYVGAEVAIGSLLILYLQTTEMGNVPEHFGSALVAYYWGGAMVGRFIGFIVLKKIRAYIGLRVVAALAFILVLLSMFSGFITSMTDISILKMGNDPVSGNYNIHFETIQIPMAALFLVLVGLCNAIMWPAIFPLGVRGLGNQTGKGSGLMVSMVLGGAIVPLLQSVIATGIKTSATEYVFGFEGIGYRFSFVVCLVCYAYIFMFAYKWYKAGKVAALYNK
jgi:MFS transporter, FHS family, L-fucose permease